MLVLVFMGRGFTCFMFTNTSPNRNSSTLGGSEIVSASRYLTPQSRGGTGVAWDLTLAGFQNTSLGTQVPEGTDHSKDKP